MSAESGTPRAPRLLPADLTEAQRDLYDAIVGPRAKGGSPFRILDADDALVGPFGNLLHAPSIGSALQEVGVALRYRSSFTARAREIAILTVAAHHGSAYETYAHQAVGRVAGLSEAEIDALERGVDPLLADPVEHAVWAITAALVRGDVDGPTWASCLPPLSVADVVELSALVGYYSTLALQMRVLRNDVVPAEEG